MQRNSAVAGVAVFLAMAIAIAAVGIGIGYGFGTTMQSAPSGITVTSTVTSTASTSNASEPYVLTLVLTTENFYNSTFGSQPAFYVLGPNGLQPSTQITLPAHRLIKLVIVNYDEGAANLTDSKYESVAGTVGNQMTVVNNTLVNSTMASSGIQVRGAESVTSLPANEIAHTFTIPALGINIPIGISSTTVTYFTLNTPGTFTWFCMTVCGGGPDGLDGAMSTPGWMAGSLAVQ